MDKKVPRDGDVHKLEGMKELVQWTPSFRPHPIGVARHVPAERDLPKSMRTPTDHTPTDDIPRGGDAEVSIPGGTVETAPSG